MMIMVAYKERKQAEVDSFIGLSSCEESEEEEIEETEAKSKPEVGDIYSTVMVLCFWVNLIGVGFISTKIYPSMPKGIT